MYVGQTSQSPVQRLRQHHTDARAAVDCATFHKLLLTTNMSDWVTIPLRYCESLFQAGLAERNWWSDLRHWAVNDIPPGISENDTSKGAPQAQCAHSATIWASGRTRDPYFEILGAPRGIMVTPSGGFDF